MSDEPPTTPIPPAPRPSRGAETPHGALSPGSKIGGRYTINEQLPRGSVDAVYKAWDDELGRQVAIRTITFHAGTDAAARGDMERRFKRDTQLAREITHPQVARILDLGNAEGGLFVVMPLIGGETLAALMQRRGPLSSRDAIAIATQVAEGLAAAHGMGVVHRNVKPENIMIADGAAVLLDLGMARSSATQTGLGGISGTVEYMAPEQSRGAGVDGRADIYALGLIVYDMLTGRKRLQGHDSAMAELLFRMRNPPPPAGKLVPDIPAALETVITRATQPNPDRRFSNAEQMRAALAAIDDESGTDRATRRSWWPRWR
jgi:serine/threonine-protein kinase